MTYGTFFYELDLLCFFVEPKVNRRIHVAGKELTMKTSDFRPEHFPNGQGFDPADFQAYLRASENMAKTLYTRYLPSVGVGILLGIFSSAAIGGFVGNILAVILIFAGLIVGAVFNMKAARPVNEITRRMGITKQDVAVARRHVKNGTYAWGGGWNYNQPYQGNAPYGGAYQDPNRNMQGNPYANSWQGPQNPAGNAGFQGGAAGSAGPAYPGEAGSRMYAAAPQEGAGQAANAVYQNGAEGGEQVKAPAEMAAGAASSAYQNGAEGGEQVKAPAEMAAGAASSAYQNGAEGGAQEEAPAEMAAGAANAAYQVRNDGVVYEAAPQEDNAGNVDTDDPDGDEHIVQEAAPEAEAAGTVDTDSQDAAGSGMDAPPQYGNFEGADAAGQNAAGNGMYTPPQYGNFEGADAAGQNAAGNGMYTPPQYGNFGEANAAGQNAAGNGMYAPPQYGNFEGVNAAGQNAAGNGMYAPPQYGGFQDVNPAGQNDAGMYAGNPAWQNYAPYAPQYAQRGMYPAESIIQNPLMRAVWAAAAMAGAWILMALVQLTFGRGLLFSYNGYALLNIGIVGTAVYLMNQESFPWKIISGCTGFAAVILMSFTGFISHILQFGGIINGSNLFFRLRDPIIGQSFMRGFVSVLFCLGAALLFSFIRKKNGKKDLMLCALISAAVYLVIRLLFQISLIRIQISSGMMTFGQVILVYILPELVDAIVIFIICMAVSVLCGSQLTEVRLRGAGLVWCWLAVVGSAAGLIMVLRSGIVDAWGMGASGLYIYQLPLVLSALAGYILLICRKRLGIFVILIGTGLMLGAQFLQGLMMIQYSNGLGMLAATLVGALNPLFAWLAVRSADGHAKTAVGGATAPSGQPVMGGATAPSGQPVMGGAAAPSGQPVMGGAAAPSGQPAMGEAAAPSGQPAMDETAVPADQPVMEGMAAPADLSEADAADTSAGQAAPEESVSLSSDGEAGGRPDAGEIPFQKYNGPGYCDVCNEPLKDVQSWIVPNDVFYSSPQWRQLQKNNIRMLIGVPGTDADIERMRMMDHSPGSAVCEKCIHMFQQN